MGIYIFSRVDMGDVVGLGPQLIVGQMFFDLWRTRRRPSTSLADGDTMLMFDTASRRLVWHLRARAVTLIQNNSLPEALKLIRQHFGLVGAELNAYIWQRPLSGWLFCWAAEVVAPLDLEMPGFRMTDYGGRNGYVDVSTVPEAMRPALPAADESAVLGVPAAYVGGVVAP